MFFYDFFTFKNVLRLLMLLLPHLNFTCNCLINLRIAGALLTKESTGRKELLPHTASQLCLQSGNSISGPRKTCLVARCKAEKPKRGAEHCQYGSDMIIVTLCGFPAINCSSQKLQYYNT